MINRTVLLPLMVAVFFFIGNSNSALAGTNCLSNGCHAKLTATKYLHGPVAAEMADVKACEMCHQPTGPACTKVKGGTFTLKSKGMCTLCHDKGTGTQHSKKQVEGKCLTCHDPHGSDVSPHMLRASRKELLKK
ncbi:MAG: hypothetical protein KJ950_06470 [Proteobacteria bacterium]|nr:hypothetical protein [Pseudomonadota bacterium]MBU1687177.1 hypothetical protein [Pseudomonadota bacterium]